VVAFVDEDVTHAPDEIEPELDLATTLDGGTPEYLADDVALVDNCSVDRDRCDDAMTHDEREHDDHRQELEPPEVAPCIGGVAGGATAAARARRLDEQAEITVIDRGPYVSYANCGLPYFIGGKIADRSQLLLQTPEGFWARYRVAVHVETEAVEIDRAAHRVRVLGPAGERWLPYDKLLLAQGGNPILPPIPGADAANVFTMWTIPDTDRLQAYLDSTKPKTAVVVGGGFIGLEMAEAFQRRGLATTIVELLPTVMGIMDRAFGVAIARELEANGIDVDTGVGVRAVHAGERTVELANGRRLPADVVLFSVGVRPELALAKAAGLAIGGSGALEVDEHLRTSDPDVYAAGDMAEILHKVTGRRVRVPLAGPANRQGRIAASNALGRTMSYRGAIGTSVVKVFEATAASTGLTEKAARDAGFDVGVAVVHKLHHAGYYPGAQELTLTLVYDRKTARLLGGQAFGRGGADKRIDVLATALQGKLTLHDLAELDLAYAPPYSSANDPVNVAAFVGLNDISGYSPLVTAAQLKSELASATPPVVLDVRSAKEHAESHLRGALRLTPEELRQEHATLPCDRRIVTHCRVGFRGHLAVRILKGLGFTNVANVTGGYLSMQAEGGFDIENGPILPPLPG
jgi:NADPH-dependent 2,4-dienoyl-CoA reductase/sulfur reductase-like enzyme/rhodanese-related sulfurtransferase